MRVDRADWPDRTDWPDRLAAGLRTRDRMGAGHEARVNVEQVVDDLLDLVVVDQGGLPVLADLDAQGVAAVDLDRHLPLVRDRLERQRVSYGDQRTADERGTGRGLGRVKHLGQPADDRPLPER